jgi:hypothetical protein
VLTKAVDLDKLHAAIAAQSPLFKGLVTTTGQPGDTLRIIDADDLTDEQVDAIIASHVPPTEAEQKDAEAQRRVDAVEALAVYLMERLNELRTQPTEAFPALTETDVRAGIVAKDKEKQERAKGPK